MIKLESIEPNQFLQDKFEQMSEMYFQFKISSCYVILQEAHLDATESELTAAFDILWSIKIPSNFSFSRGGF